MIDCTVLAMWLKIALAVSQPPTKKSQDKLILNDTSQTIKFGHRSVSVPKLEFTHAHLFDIFDKNDISMIVQKLSTELGVLPKTEESMILQAACVKVRRTVQKWS